MRFTQLDQWLDWQSALHPSTIELGLERVRTVYQSLHYTTGLPLVLTVAGTNGKGSTLAMLETVLLADGYRVGKYTSPHLYDYNERICINARPVADNVICEAFERIDTARGEISLTYFEFGTLAALDIFHGAGLDVVLLETGLGGRLDAVNIIDADLSIISSIDIDHTDWLGDSRESIAREKMGIARSGRPCVVADLSPPTGMLETAKANGIEIHAIGHEFGFQANAIEPGRWLWWGAEQKVELPMPSLRGQQQLRNASAVIMALQLLRRRLPVSMAAIRTGIANTHLAGRFEVQQINGVTEIRDVAHNPAATMELAVSLRDMVTPGDRRAVFAVMADKDLAQILQPLLPLISQWYIAPLETTRAATVEQITQVLVNSGVDRRNIIQAESIVQAREQALCVSEANDQLLVFGSFYTLGAIHSEEEVVN